MLHTKVGGGMESPAVDGAAPPSPPSCALDPPPVGFNTFTSRVRAVASFESAKIRHSYGGKNGAFGYPPRTASLGQTQAVSGALIAFNTKCKAAEAERDTWMEKCEEMERELEKTKEALESTTADLEVRVRECVYMIQATKQQKIRKR